VELITPSSQMSGTGHSWRAVPEQAIDLIQFSGSVVLLRIIWCTMSNLL